MTTGSHWLTILMVLKEDLEEQLITTTLGLTPTAVVRRGEIPIPTFEEGAGRYFDERYYRCDHWKRALSGKQLKHDLAEQLQFWIQQLYAAREALRHLKELGYWCVIDCQGYSDSQPYGSVQFRLSSDLQAKLSKLALDVDVTVYTAGT